MELLYALEGIRAPILDGALGVITYLGSEALSFLRSVVRIPVLKFL